ncbi:hypothetical protein GE115_02565 [Agromyces sp. CFH 90414]|uniref:Alpha/beta hydrolase n=1 Tax=Agromyces agglutinans TaxID=2662258 RepID=A0A6I2F7L0_9MICO|nr:hypothetical protein [Agromyces agglutinans]MRG58760.1 hypothetical protein [Agromyces agglutinans]
MPRIERLTSEASSGAPVALVLPGAGYTIQGPLLYWPVLALEQAGWDVWSANWHTEITDSVRRDLAKFIKETLSQADDVLPGPPNVVIGKSLGTHALPYFVDRAVRAAWITPLLTVPAIADAARVASASHLLVGGTADPSWEPDAIRGTRAEIVVVPSGNHSLETDGAGWEASAKSQLDALARVIAHIL